MGGAGSVGEDRSVLVSGRARLFVFSIFLFRGSAIREVGSGFRRSFCCVFSVYLVNFI